MPILTAERIKPHYRYNWETKAIRIVQARKAFDYSYKQLNRARRLYKYMVYVRLFKATDKVDFNELMRCAYNAKLRGLYSHSTPLKDVIFGLVSYAYRRVPNRELNWGQWAELKVPQFWYKRINSYESDWVRRFSGRGKWPWQ